ncbi:hypothetical protein BGX38DRAFT_1262386 [Terfezia claveryi]|nr:hypothetical protein BGX38DRAFT_1262386 [Terfezia claveryi]
MERDCVQEYLAMRLEGDAKKWWEDYSSKGVQGDSDSPNCWRKHSDMKRPISDGSGNVEEVSLYELLKKQFSGEVDARAVEIELASRTHMERLMKGAKKTDEFNRMRCIRNALPNNIKTKTEIGESEEELWQSIRQIHTTMEIDELDKGIASLGVQTCTNYGKQGHSADTCKKKKEEQSGSTPMHAIAADVKGMSLIPAFRRSIRTAQPCLNIQR